MPRPSDLNESIGIPRFRAYIWLISPFVPRALSDIATGGVSERGCIPVIRRVLNHFRVCYGGTYPVAGKGGLLRSGGVNPGSVGKEYGGLDFPAL